jgi:type VI secretion system protein ImpL
LNPVFLSGAGRLTALGGSILQEGDGARFELQPIPTPGFSEILIEIDGQTLRYRNGPQPWTTFAWPNATQVQGARLQVVSFGGVTTPIANHNGRMGLMRMLSQARTNQVGAPVATLEWRFKPQGGRDESVPIRFNFRAVSGPNPLVLAELRRLALPERIAN